MEKRQILKGYAYTVLSAVIFGCMPLMAKYIYADGVNAMTLVLVRNVMSLPFLFGLGFFQREAFSAPPKKLISVMIIGVFGCALTPFLLFSSYSYMNSGTATVFHFVYPALVLLLELLLLRGRASRRSLAAVLLCVLGIALFYPVGESISLAGSVLALSSGLTYAIYIFLLGKFGRGGLGGYAFSFFATLGSTVAMLPVCLVSGGLSLPQTLLGWLLCLVFALMINVGAVVLFQNGAFLIGGQRASVFSTLEPITSLIVGFLFLHERVGILSVLGSLLVISASVLISRQDREAQ